MPIMGMQDVRPPLRVRALRQRRGGPAEQRKPAMIVGPFAAHRIGIGAARPVVKGGVIDEIRANTALRQFGQRDPHPLDGKRRANARDLAQRQAIKQRGEARQHQPDIDTKSGQCRRQCRDDIAEPAGLDPRKQLGRGMQYPHQPSPAPRERVPERNARRRVRVSR